MPFFTIREKLVELALTRFEARVGLVDHIEATLTTHYLAIGMTILG